MRRREEGFTLIELAVSLGLFAVALVSLSLLFDRAIEATGRVRTDEVGKTLAQRKLEEIRSYPFFVSQKENGADVDVLDLYFPRAASGTTPTGATGSYDGTTGVWTYTSTESVTSEQRSFTRTVAVRFVVPQDDGTLQARPPIDGYDSDDATRDTPATESVSVTVTVSWTSAGEPRSVSLDTVITGIRREDPSVDASGSFLAAQVSGVTFQDGDVGGIAAEILGTAGQGQISFREVAEGSSHARADPVQIVERDPATGASVQPDGPADGESTASVPNSTTGTQHAPTPSNLAADSFDSANGSGIIAAWDAAEPASATEARISGLHTLNPEARATVTVNGFRLNARDEADVAPLPVLELGAVSGEVRQQSTTVDSRVTASVDLSSTQTGPGVAVQGSRSFNAHPGYRGVIVMDALHVDVESTAGATTASTVVNWRVNGLRVWDPDALSTEQVLGAYGPAYTFGFRSDCGGWVDDPAACGPLRTDGKEPFENPNPVVIPEAYTGLDPQGAPATSLSIVAGVTVQDSSADASTGVSSASVSQKNVLSITLRDDVIGAAAVESALIGVGDANATVSYVAHEH